jgi:hypothetical protein
MLTISIPRCVCGSTTPGLHGAGCPRQSTYPASRPADEWDREYLLDVAAAAQRDSWPLVGQRDLVEALCRELGAVASELDAERERRRCAPRATLTIARIEIPLGADFGDVIDVAGEFR